MNWLYSSGLSFAAPRRWGNWGGGRIHGKEGGLSCCCEKEWTWYGILFAKICFQGPVREHSERSALLSGDFSNASGVNYVRRGVYPKFLLDSVANYPWITGGSAECYEIRSRKNTDSFAAQRLPVADRLLCVMA